MNSAWRQSLFADSVVVRFGKLVPTNDFDNVVRPVPVQDPSLKIPAVSGLLYTPIFVNPTILGVLPGYYNSAYGVTVTLAPTKNWYLSLGSYDGNLADRVQTGLEFTLPSTAIASRSASSEPPGSSARSAFQARSPSAPGTRLDC